MENVVGLLTCDFNFANNNYVNVFGTITIYDRIDEVFCTIVRIMSFKISHLNNGSVGTHTEKGITNCQCSRTVVGRLIALQGEREGKFNGK